MNACRSAVPEYPAARVRAWSVSIDAPASYAASAKSRKHIEEEGISPTLDEIAAAFSFSPAAAHYAIDALARKGALEKDEGRSRGIRLKDEERDETSYLDFIGSEDFSPKVLDDIMLEKIQKGMDSLPRNERYILNSFFISIYRTVNCCNDITSISVFKIYAMNYRCRRLADY